MAMAAESTQLFMFFSSLAAPHRRTFAEKRCDALREICTTINQADQIIAVGNLRSLDAADHFFGRKHRQRRLPGNAPAEFLRSAIDFLRFGRSRHKPAAYSF